MKRMSAAGEVIRKLGEAGGLKMRRLITFIESVKVVISSPCVLLKH